MSVRLMKSGMISRTKQSAVGDQDLCHSVLRGCSRSVFAVVNKGGEVSLCFFLVILKFKYKSGDIKINKMSEVPELYRKDLLDRKSTRLNSSHRP